MNADSYCVVSPSHHSDPLIVNISFHLTVSFKRSERRTEDAARARRRTTFVHLVRWDRAEFMLRSNRLDEHAGVERLDARRTSRLVFRVTR